MARSNLINLGAGAASMSAIIAAYLMISPILASDSPPFAGTARVIAVAQTAEQTQKLLEQTAQSLRRLADKQDQSDLDYWNGQHALAEARLKAMPSDELARTLLKLANDKIAEITTRIAGK